MSSHNFKSWTIFVLLHASMSSALIGCAVETRDFEAESGSGASGAILTCDTAVGSRSPSRAHNPSPTFVTSYAPGAFVASAAEYVGALDQFKVECNPRYAANAAAGLTYCNIFLWDTTTALGFQIPHWVDRTTDRPAASLASNAKELTANATIEWLHAHAGDTLFHAWQSLGYGSTVGQQAHALANQGIPVVAAWHSGLSNTVGHVALVVPSALPYSVSDGPMVAQAGLYNFGTTSPVRARTGFFGSTALPPMAQIEYFAPTFLVDF